MAPPANADVVAAALLRYFRHPAQYRTEMLFANEVTGNLELVVRLGLGKPVELADRALRKPAVASELVRAALFFVGQTLFREDASHYQILGLAPDAPADAVRENHRLLIQIVHPDRRNGGVVWPESVAARVNHAYSVLKDPETRARYDRLQSDARGMHATTMREAGAIHAPRRRIVPGRRPVKLPVLPEWLTAGVGGFVRQHPAFTTFTVVIAICVLSVGGVIWSERELTLTRDVPRTASGEDAAPGAGFNGTQPSFGAGASQAFQAGEQPMPGPATAEGQQVPVALDGSVVKGFATSPVNSANQRAPLAMPTPNRLQSRIGATASEHPAPAHVGAPAAARPLSSAGSAPSPSGSTVSQDRQVASREPAALTAMPAIAASTSTIQAAVAENLPPAAPSRTEPSADAVSKAPNSAEVEALIAAFISFYEGGRLDAFAALFDVDARTNEFHGRAAIRSDYDELFRRTRWRRISLRQLQWRAVGERTEANGEIALKIGWHDGREVEQRVALDMELMHRGGRTVIARLSQRVRD